MLLHEQRLNLALEAVVPGAGLVRNAARSSTLQASTA